MDRIRTAVSEAKKARARAAQAAKPQKCTPEQIRHTTTPLVSVDSKYLHANKIFAFDQDDPRSLRFDILRTKTLQKMDMNAWQTLGITSPTGGCGKTVVAINLAASIARQINHTVLLIDFDMRKPAIADYLGLRPRAGLKEYLNGDVELAQTLISPGLERLVMLLNFGRIRGSSEIIVTGRCRDLVVEVKQRYPDRIVIFDLPPLLETDDVIALLPDLDCTLLVAAEGETSVADLESCTIALQETANLGVVLNKSTEPASTYSYY